MLRRLALFLVLSIFSLYAAQSEFYVSAKSEADDRWQAFQAGRQFIEFKPGRSEEELNEEFENIRKTRFFIWATDGYELAEHLIAEDLVRAPSCTAFSFNNTVPYYNASTICLGERCFIACEGPRSKDVSKFFNLLTSQRVTHLVRLTGTHEAWIKKCHPYWEGVVKEFNGNAYLSIPTDSGEHSVQAFHMDCWKDNQGVDPEELLALVLQVRKELNREDSLLAVHCSAGVGRTGTFLAGLAVVDAIDRGLPFSIEEIVYRLSLQRIHSVAKFGQYFTLHRLAEIYLDKVKTAKESS